MSPGHDPDAAPLVRPPRLSTERLVLRAFELDDTDARLAYQGRTDVSRYLFRAPHDAVSVRAGIVRNQEGRFGEVDDRLLLAVVERATGQLVGEVSARLDDVEAAQVEIGWVFHPGYAGRGYATEAAGALVDDLFERRGAHRVFARIDVANEASERLCLRLGLRREALFRENALWQGSCRPRPCTRACARGEARR